MSYPVKELLTAMLVVSGNDAAGALATAVGGTASAAELMNAEAARLQARDTQAVNPSGLDAKGQVSSAYDLALIARAGMALPSFREYVATQTSSISAPKKKRIEIYNHNRLLRDYDGAIGIKNGYTVAARASFVGAATRGGHTLLVTLLRADPLVWREAEALLDWGFAAVEAGVAPGRAARRPAGRGPAVEARGVEAGAVSAAPGAPLQAVPAAVSSRPRRTAASRGGRCSRWWPCCSWPSWPAAARSWPAAGAGAARCRSPARRGVASPTCARRGPAPSADQLRRSAPRADRRACTTTTAVSAPTAPIPTDAARTAVCAPGGRATGTRTGTSTGSGRSSGTPACRASSGLDVPEGARSESYGPVTVQAAVSSSSRETRLRNSSRPTTTAKAP